VTQYPGRMGAFAPGYSIWGKVTGQEERRGALLMLQLQAVNSGGRPCAQAGAESFNSFVIYILQLKPSKLTICGEIHTVNS
jgi:hypothetical protein